MTRVLWIHAEPDPVASGELRRLGVAALGLAGEQWQCEFVSRAAARGRRADVVVLPLSAADVLPQIEDPAAVGVIVEVDFQSLSSIPDAAAVLGGLANRIDGVVARGPRAAMWAGRVLEGAVPVWLIPDPALRRVELEAAAVQLDLPFPGASTDFPDDFELWFCEPGDQIEPAEMQALAEAWSQPAPGRLIVAPRMIRTWFEMAGGRAASLEWTPRTLEQAFARARRCVFMGPETYRQARRRATALRSGAAAAPSSTAAAHEFEPSLIVSQWEQALTSAAPPMAATRSGPPFKVLIFVDLIQDFDPAAPLISSLIKRRGFAVEVALTSWLQRRSPRVEAELQAMGAPYTLCDRDAVAAGTAPLLTGVDAVVAVAESSLGVHARSHALIERARAAKLPTACLQHGVENVGLHPVAGAEDAEVAADFMFVWFPPEAVPATAPAALKPRLIHVGRPRPPAPPLAEIRSAFVAFDSIVTVFENLHWVRYDEAWRTRFLTDCAQFAFADPSRAVILKPHHAGLWSVKNRHLIPLWPANLVIADPTDSFWEPFTAGALVQVADAVVTTPSTVALDAVQAGKPVAVAAYGLELAAYAPLPLLQSVENWFSFMAEAGGVEDARRRALFLNHTAAGDDPAEAITAHLTAAVRRRRLAAAGERAGRRAQA